MARTKKKHRENKGAAIPYSKKEKAANTVQSNKNYPSDSNNEGSDLHQSSKQTKQSNNEEIKRVSMTTQTDDILTTSIAVQTDDIDVKSTARGTINNNDYSNVNTDVYLVPQVPKLPRTFGEK